MIHTFLILSGYPMRRGCFHFGNNLSFVDADWLVIDGVDDFEFEGLRVILVCHEASDDTGGAWS